MLLLALETSTRQASVALARDGVVIAERDLPHPQRAAQTLTPACRELVASAGAEPRAVEVVAVSIGPGSFTGLRIGVVAAKALAYAIGADLVAVNSLQVVAEQAEPRDEHVVAIANAYRGQLFSQAFRRDASDTCEALAEAEILGADQWLERDWSGFQITGDGLKRVADRLSSAARRTAEACWRPRASTLAITGRRLHARGVCHDLWTLAPNYLRPSAAEEKLAERHDSSE